MVLVLEETGRSLFPSPLISTVLAARAIELGGNEAQQERWLPGLADGSLVGADAMTEPETPSASKVGRGPIRRHTKGTITTASTPVARSNSIF